MVVVVVVVHGDGDGGMKWKVEVRAIVIWREKIRQREKDMAGRKLKLRKERYDAYGGKRCGGKDTAGKSVARRRAGFASARRCGTFPTDAWNVHFGDNSYGRFIMWPYKIVANIRIGRSRTEIQFHFRPANAKALFYLRKIETGRKGLDK